MHRNTRRAQVRSFHEHHSDAGLLLSVIFAGLSLPLALHAQPAGSFIEGRVYGVGGAPLEGADVLILGNDHRTVTDMEGRFRLNGIGSGAHTVIVRMVGYEPNRIVIAVGDDGVRGLEVFLTQLPATLDRIIVLGERRGITGIVLDPDDRPVKGAQVRIVGAGEVYRTDSTGRFYFPARHGSTYTVRVTMDGYLARPAFLGVPAGGVRDATIRLAYAPNGYRPPAAEEWHYHALGFRTSVTSPLGRMGDGEIDRFNGMRLCDIPKVRAMLRTDRPMVVINGTQVIRAGWLCGWVADDVGLIELDVPCNDFGLLITNLRVPPPKGNGTCVAIWLR